MFNYLLKIINNIIDYFFRKNTDVNDNHIFNHLTTIINHLNIDIFKINMLNNNLYKRTKLWLYNKETNNSSITNFYNKLNNNTISRDDPLFNLNGIDGLVTLYLILYQYSKNSVEYNNIIKQFEDTSIDFKIIETLFYFITCITDTEKINNINMLSNESEDINNIRIPNKCKIAIISDWASNTIRAENVIKEISKMKPDYIIHLGDVYYSGTIEEQKINLIEPL